MLAASAAAAAAVSATKVDRSLEARPLRIRVCEEVHAESQSPAWQHRLP